MKNQNWQNPGKNVFKEKNHEFIHTTKAQCNSSASSKLQQLVNVYEGWIKCGGAAVAWDSDDNSNWISQGNVITITINIQDRNHQFFLEDFWIQVSSVGRFCWKWQQHENLLQVQKL